MIRSICLSLRGVFFPPKGHIPFGIPWGRDPTSQHFPPQVLLFWPACATTTGVTTDLALSPTPSLEQVTTALDSFTAGQLRYLEALQETTSKNQACLKAGVSIDCVYKWRSTFPDFKALDDAWSLRQDVHHRTAIAKAILGQHAPKASLRIVKMAEAEGTTDRQLQVAFQANVKVLEAVGVLKTGSGIQVNVDNRRVDVYAKERWLSGGQDAWRSRKRLASAKEPDEKGTG